MLANKSKGLLIDLDKSSSTEVTQRPSTASTVETAKNESSKTKPQFIVKKVVPEELFKNPAKSNNMAGLTQINEENTADLEEVLPRISSTNLKQDRKEPENVFKTEMVDSSKYKEQYKGPVYKAGTVVKHSIVGSVEIFERYQRLLKKKSKESGLFPAKDSFNNDISALKDARPQSSVQERTSITYSERPESQKNHFTSKNHILAEKKSKNELKLTKDEILAEIDKHKERHDGFSKDESQKKKNRPLSTRLYLTKQERNLQKFEKVVDEWENIAEKCNKKINREGSSSVMFSTDDHREKKELVEILDIIQTDQERFGTKLWYHTLRKYKDINNIPSKGIPLQLIPQTAEEIFQTTQIQKQLSSLEYIRKPSLTKTPLETRHIQTRPSSSKLGTNYLENKLTSRKHIVNEIQPTDIEELNNLGIKGKNKLELEAQAILKQINNKEVVKVPKYFMEKKETKNNEEIIVKDHTKMEIFKNGLNVFVD